VGSRSRKRRRPADVPASPPTPSPERDAAARSAGPDDALPSRRRRRVVVGDAAFAPREAPAPRVRGEARNEQIRSGLEPLAPGERPRPLVAAAAIAALLAVANIGMYAAGYDLRGNDDPSLAGVLVFSVILLAAAAGMWAMRYWAVLGFECLLAITVVYAAIGLAVASNVRAVVLCLAVIGAAGWLFWKLIRVMARIQMPRRPGAVRG
jgi:hypothetical protein